MDSDGQVDWAEFLVYLKWALHQYPKDISTMEDLLDITFRKGLIPAMRDEREKMEKEKTNKEQQPEGKEQGQKPNVVRRLRLGFICGDILTD